MPRRVPELLAARSPEPSTHTTAREIIQETIAAAAARPLPRPGPNGRGSASARPIGSEAARMHPCGRAGPGAAGGEGVAGSVPPGGRRSGWGGPGGCSP